MDENIFLCWSGERSKALAQALHDWLPRVIQAAKPFISTETEKGARWFEEIGRKLENISIGIICLTPENLDERWLHFEAGALSKQVDQARVCPYLLGFKPADVPPPLGLFQGTVADRESTRQLLDTINRAVCEAPLTVEILNDVFNRFWPDLEKRITEIKALDSKLPKTKHAARSDAEKLDELLYLFRHSAAKLPSTDAIVSLRPTEHVRIEHNVKPGMGAEFRRVVKEWGATILDHTAKDYVDEYVLAVAIGRNVEGLKNKLRQIPGVTTVK